MRTISALEVFIDRSAPCPSDIGYIDQRSKYLIAKEWEQCFRRFRSYHKTRQRLYEDYVELHTSLELKNARDSYYTINREHNNLSTGLNKCKNRLSYWKEIKAGWFNKEKVRQNSQLRQELLDSIQQYTNALSKLDLQFSEVKPITIHYFQR
jgi:hypothetical protein